MTLHADLWDRPAQDRALIAGAVTPRSRIEVMHAREGIAKGHTCGQCAHLLRLGAGRGYFKCRQYGITRSAETDWRKKYPACGAFTEPQPSQPAPDAS